jgi:hypothetical protein
MPRIVPPDLNTIEPAVRAILEYVLINIAAGGNGKTERTL